jgi:CRISPR-associated endoribonuclease Cas6
VIEIQAPERLYALLIKLRPLEYGTLMPFSGEFVHAALLDWIRDAAPDIAAMLHDGNQRRLFTCSNLQFPLAAQRLRDAERGNVHLPLYPEKVYTIRLTLLLGELFPLFYSLLTRYSSKGSRTENKPFLRLGKQAFLLEEVVSMPEDGHHWSGYASFGEFVENARSLRLKPAERLTLEFATLTTFHRGLADSKYGKHYTLLPLPQFVFPWLARRWRELAPTELADVIQREPIERYIAEDGVIIDDHTLLTHWVQFNRHPQRGFLGTCTYELRGPDEVNASPDQLTIRQQLILLSWLAFYTGVGYKTTMGMGQVRLK